jgi:hypothetical protein
MGAVTDKPTPNPLSDQAGVGLEEQSRLEELFAEIGRSPLDDRPVRHGVRRRLPAMIAAALAVGGGIAAAVLLLGRGEAVPPTSTAATVAESPPGLVLHSAVYDPALQAVLVFGGTIQTAEANMNDRTGALGELSAETWLYRADSGWARLAASEVRPSPRAAHSAAFASDAGLMVVFGGSDSAPVNCQRELVCSDSLLDDTWVLDPASGAWSQRHPSAGPTARIGAAMAYDAGAQRVILFGGNSGEGTWTGNIILDDTWAYDPVTDTWEDRAPATAPPGRIFGLMGYDPVSGRILLWGGASWENDAVVWAYDYAANSWTSLGDRGAPSARWSAGAAYDTTLQGLVIAGGIGMTTVEIAAGVSATHVGVIDEAWLFRPDSVSWAPLPAPSTSGVPLQARFAAAYDQAAGALVAYGGGGSETSTVLFEDDQTAWVDAFPGTEDTTTLP